jgi:hypothetical protein
VRRGALALGLKLAVLAGATATTTPAAAQSCDALARWSEDCRGVDLTIVHCVEGGVVLDAVAAGGDPLRIEIARGRVDAFVRVGDVGLSPVGEFADWSEAPASFREAFAAVRQCVEANPTLSLPEGEFEVGQSPRSTPATTPPIPWFLLLGLAGAAGAAYAARRQARSPPSARRTSGRALVAVALTVGTFALRRVLVEPGFAHQNGQGPLWVSHALCVPTVYGPGYREVFGWIASLGEPSVAVFTAQAILAAFGPVLAWVIVRGTGARRELAWAAAVVVAADPTLARLAQSESYFATESTLLLAAAAVTSAGSCRRRIRDPVFLIAVASAGCFVAQAARIHPTAWVAAAVIPLVVAAGRGRLRGRLVAAAAATAGVGAVAAIGALPVMTAVVGGGVGDDWLPGFFSRIPQTRIDIAIFTAAIAAAAIIGVSPDRGRGAVRAGATATVILAVGFTHVIGGVAADVVLAGYVVLFAGPLLGCAGVAVSASALGGRPRRARLAAAAVIAAALGAGAVRAPALWERPTDEREQDRLLAWRDALPADATVVHLGAAGRRRFHLPYYGHCVPGSARAVQLSSEEPIRDLSKMPSPVLWYRSAICSTEEGRRGCEAVETTATLVVLRTAEIEARASMEDLEYDTDPVGVSLFAVEGPAP